MNQETLEKFNIELKALLIKYNCTLQIGQSIQVVENKPEPVVAEKTSDEDTSTKSV